MTSFRTHTRFSFFNETIIFLEKTFGDTGGKN
jgi:hypothetical protein